MNELELQEKVIEPVANQAVDIVINSLHSYAKSDEILGEIKGAQKFVKDFFSDMKAKTYAAWKAVTTKESDLLNPLISAEASVKTKMLEFKRIQGKKKEEEEDRLQAKADVEARRERERLKKRAEKVKSPELKQQAQDQADAVVAPIVKIESVIPQTKGTVYKKTWVGLVVDKGEALKAASDNPVLGALFEIDQGRLNRLAVSFKGELELTGIEFREVESIAKGAR